MASASPATTKHFSCVGVKTSPNLINEVGGLSPVVNNNNQISFSFTSPNSFSFVHSNSSPSFLTGDSKQGRVFSASNTNNTSISNDNTRNSQKRTPKKSPTKKSTCSKNIFNISLSTTTGNGATAMNGFSFKFPPNTTAATTTPSLFSTNNTETSSSSSSTTTTENPTTSISTKTDISSNAVVVASNDSASSFNNLQLNSLGFTAPKFGGSVISVPTFAAPTATFSSHSASRNGASSNVQNGFSHNESVSSPSSSTQPSLSTTSPPIGYGFQEEYRETTSIPNSPILRPATFTPPKHSPTIFRGFGASSTPPTSTPLLNNTWAFSNSTSTTLSKSTTLNGLLNSSPSISFSTAATENGFPKSSSTTRRKNTTTAAVNGFSNSASSASYRTATNGFLSSSSSSSSISSSTFVEPRKPENQNSTKRGASNLPRPESPLFQYARTSTLSSTQNFDFAKDGKEWHSKNNGSFLNPNAVKKKDKKHKDGRSSRSKHRSKDKDTKTTTALTQAPDQIDISTTTTNSATTGKTNTTSPQQPSQHVMKEISTLNNSVREFKVLLRELNGIRAFNDMRTVSMMIESLEKNIRSIRECFKCEICFTSQYNHFFFCQDCGRMVGCFLCAYRLDRCPTCRKRLPPKKNRSPHVIPGLAAAMDEKELSRDELWKQVEKIRV